MCRFCDGKMKNIFIFFKENFNPFLNKILVLILGLIESLYRNYLCCREFTYDDKIVIY